jgi:DNA-binding response OmpR family regulator
MNILIVEDDSAIAMGLQDDLQLEGYTMSVCTDAANALAHIAANPVDLLLLDIMLPGGMDGFDLCRHLRRHHNEIPIIMLTARTHETDTILGLELGADDYIRKPFTSRELRARVKALLRRASSNTVLRIGDLSIDASRYEVRRGHRRIETTPTEYKILYALVEARGRVLTREQLIASAWGPGANITDRVVDNHIANLRKKIEDNPARPTYVLSARGFGYCTPTTS